MVVSVLVVVLRTQEAKKRPERAKSLHEVSIHAQRSLRVPALQRGNSQRTGF